MQKVDQEGYEEQITSGFAQALYHCKDHLTQTEGLPSFHSLSLQKICLLKEYDYIRRSSGSSFLKLLAPNPQGPGISVCPDLVVGVVDVNLIVLES